VAEPDHLELRRDGREVADVHRHRVGVVEQPGVRAQLTDVRGDARQHREGTQRAEDAADADGVRDGLAQPVLRRDLEVAHGRRVHPDLDRVDHEVGAVEHRPPVQAGGHHRIRAELLRDPPGDRLRRLQPFRVDVVQGQRHAFELVERKDVGEQFAGEDHAAGTEESDHSHGGILGCDERSVQGKLVYRSETDYVDCAFDHSWG
jgi:hypothetical protein